MARGILIFGKRISSPIATQASNPAKHHQIMQTAPMKVKSLSLAINSGDFTKFGSSMFGIMVRNQMAATPQKKNIKPFCSRPVSLTPKTLAIMKPIVTINATATLDNGICQSKGKTECLEVVTKGQRFTAGHSDQ